MATEFTMTFDTGNAAFDDGDGQHEAGRIVSLVAARIRTGHEGGVIHDINGNRIGQWSLELPEADEEDSEEEE